MHALELVKLPPLMQRTSGSEEIKVALIDGPVAMDHPDFAGQNIQEVAGRHAHVCSRPHSVACMHGTFIAGILCAKRGSIAPAICPACTLLVRPIFSESSSINGDAPSAQPQELASAIVETIYAGARLINLSAALAQPSPKGEHILGEALDHAARGNVIVVAAAGNQGTIGSSVITRHPWVVPVAGCDLNGRPTSDSNLGNSIGRNGMMAPARGITSIGTSDKVLRGCFVIASKGKGVTKIAHTTACIVMRAPASGQPSPIMCKVAKITFGVNDKIRITVATRRHVRTGFG